MTRRTRLTGALLALLALILSFGETVWASTCASATPMPAVATAASHETSTAPRHGHDHDEGHERGDPCETSGDCPVGSSLAAQACAGVASLPARVSSLSASSWERLAGVVVSKARPDLLLPSALFRPPRA